MKCERCGMDFTTRGSVIHTETYTGMWSTDYEAHIPTAGTLVTESEGSDDFLEVTLYRKAPRCRGCGLAIDVESLEFDYQH